MPDNLRQESRFFAHTLPGRPTAEWQLLQDHLAAVALLAAQFSGRFGASEWGRLAGWYHDAGKFSEAFQKYLGNQPDWDFHTSELDISDAEKPAARAQRGPDHSTAGAQFLVEHCPPNRAGWHHLLAYPILGHHAGLTDAVAGGSSVHARLGKAVESWHEQASGQLPAPPFSLDLPPALTSGRDQKQLAFALALFSRMLFSCLVDADFLDTEAFMDPGRSKLRPVWPPDILHQMRAALDVHAAAFGTPSNPVDQIRAEVRQACRKAAPLDPGLFSLTVPTGGGKTLSSLAFALDHAIRHGLDRIIYVIPFTSIIEQNAAEFRRVFAGRLDGPDPVLEHHSAVSIDDTDGRGESSASRLSAENWDAPLVVTTSVQFYESLFARRTSRCRKLHNMARAVIVLDEAQKIPVDYLNPCLAALRELTQAYGSSVVLCTATQPAIHKREDFKSGLEGVREIIDDRPALYRSLKRVRVEPIGPRADAELVEAMAEHRQSLSVVNTRGHAYRLFQLAKTRLPTDTVIHLSAAMCPAHRSATLDDVRNRLTGGAPIHVISTQLIEAGVDIDFPVVFRSMAGLDSVAQAAGRCNRHGRRPEGITYLFESEHGDSEAFLRDTVQTARQIVGGGDAAPMFDDLLSLEAVEKYFELYYWSQSDRHDRKGILGEFKIGGGEMPIVFNFRAAADKFRLIEDTGQPVIVPWGADGARICDEIRVSCVFPAAATLRQAQRYTVQVPRRAWDKAMTQGLIKLAHDRLPILTSTLHYMDDVGLALDLEDLPIAKMIT